MIRKYRIESVGSDGNEQWLDELGGAEATVAQRLALDVGVIGAGRRTINLDPVVVKHEGARWRSRSVWQYRSDSAGQARIYEMLRIDEAEYDH